MLAEPAAPAVPILFTERAADKVKTLLAEEGRMDLSLRILVSGGGCSGFQYGFAFDDPREDDLLCRGEGVEVRIDPVSARYVQGSVVDYVDGLAGSGFSVRNPNARGACGCGQSFHVD